MYAIKGQSWRAIQSEDDLLPGETLSNTIPPDLEGDRPILEYEFSVPIKAPDFIVASPIPKDKPDEALAEAVKESKKPHGTGKSVPVIVINLMRYIENLEERVAILENKKVKP